MRARQQKRKFLPYEELESDGKLAYRRYMRDLEFEYEWRNKKRPNPKTAYLEELKAYDNVMTRKLNRVKN